MHVVGKMKGHILDLPLPGSAAAQVVGHITPEDLLKTARQRSPR
jgi:putative protease